MSGKCRVLLALLVLPLAAAGLARAGPALRVLGVHYRPDQPFPHYLPFWTESWDLKDAAGQTVQHAYPGMPLGGSLHAFVRNDSADPLEVDDVLLRDISLTRAVAFSADIRKRDLRPASLHFADLADAERAALAQAGQPVWWRVDPSPIPAGGTAEVLVRLRRAPELSRVGLTLVSGGVREAVGVRTAPSPASIQTVTFPPDLAGICVYFQSRARPGRVLLDGQDVTGSATIEWDAALGFGLADIDLAESLEPGSFHCVQLAFPGRRTASMGRRAYADGEICYGMWGSRPGKEGDTALARAYLDDLRAHNINVQMEMVGSAAVREFLKSDDGLALCSDLGLRRMVSAPGKGNVTQPWACFLQDEPDCGDFRVDALPPAERVGSLAQDLVERSADFRETDRLTPQLLNVDMTFKPDNWYVYGQLPDILAVDPYYQERLRDAYWEHPSRLPLYAKATYIYAVGQVARSACAPKPLHVILNSVCRTGGERRFRYGTPEEKRIEVYYALAAGASGVSYWWYTPIPPCVGCGAQDDPDAVALWREIGLLGAEVRTIGPLILQSCPAELPTKATRNLWVRTLLSGPDAVLVLVVNDDYASDRLGTVYQPIANATAAVTLPTWLEAKTCFEVTCRGTRDVDWQLAEEGLELALGTVDLTRLVVITSDEGLRARLQALYDKQLADTTARLLATEAPEG